MFMCDLEFVKRLILIDGLVFWYIPEMLGGQECVTCMTLGLDST